MTLDEITATTEKLQTIVEERYGGDDYWYWQIEHRRDGWYATAEYARFFGDQGEYLGDTPEIAIKSINLLMNDQT